MIKMCFKVEKKLTETNQCFYTMSELKNDLKVKIGGNLDDDCDIDIGGFVSSEEDEPMSGKDLQAGLVFFGLKESQLSTKFQEEN